MNYTVPVFPLVSSTCNVIKKNLFILSVAVFGFLTIRQLLVFGLNEISNTTTAFPYVYHMAMKAYSICFLPLLFFILLQVSKKQRIAIIFAEYRLFLLPYLGLTIVCIWTEYAMTFFCLLAGFFVPKVILLSLCFVYCCCVFVPSVFFVPLIIIDKKIGFLDAQGHSRRLVVNNKRLFLQLFTAILLGIALFCFPFITQITAVATGGYTITYNLPDLWFYLDICGSRIVLIDLVKWIVFPLIAAFVLIFYTQLYLLLEKQNTTENKVIKSV